MRLQAYLARSGAAPSRRKAEALISGGRVVVNGEIASLGTSVAPGDRVLLDGEPVSLPAELSYLALNKPRGYLTSFRDELGEGRRTVADLMPEVPGLVPVGRLDAQTTGLLILTNDGRLAHRIAHPSTELQKEYLLTVETPDSGEPLRALQAGPVLEDGRMLPPRLTGVEVSGGRTTFYLTIHEGRNRIIRRACRAVGLPLLSLRRVRVGPVLLGDLPEGRYRNLTPDELAALG